MNFTTIENLQDSVSATYGAVIKYGDKVFVTDIAWKGGFTAKIYYFVELPKATGLSDIECKLAPFAIADETFKDNGSALQWCFNQLLTGC